MGWVVNATPRSLYPQERPGTYCIGGWVGPRAGMDWCGKSLPPPGFDPLTHQPVAGRYTDYTTPVPRLRAVQPRNRVSIPREEYSPPSKASRINLGSTRLSIKYVSGLIPPAIIHLGHEAHH